MNAAFAQRTRAARRLAGIGALGLCILASAAAPALAGGSAKPGQRGAGKNITLRYYSVTASFVYTRADGTVLPQPPQKAAPGDKMEIIENAYKGAHTNHSKQIVATAHTVCVFTAGSPAPTCDGQAAIGGNQMLLFHTPGGGDTVVSGGTGRYLGATGTVAMTEVGNTNNTDLVIVVHLRK